MARRRHVELYQGQRDRKWRFRVVGANGEKMDASEPYARKANAKRAAERLQPELPIITVP